MLLELIRTLDWATTELQMNPHVIGNAQTEVHSVLGKKRVVAECDIHQLQYTRAVKLVDIQRS